MKTTGLQQIARAYLASIAIWCCLSLLTGWQYHIFDQALNIHSTMSEMLWLAEARGFALALLTPPIFYFVRRYNGGMGHMARYVIAFIFGVGPFLGLYAVIHWLLLPPWDPVLQRYVARVGHDPLQIIRSGFADQITMYIAIVLAAHAYEYFERVRRQNLERSEYQRALAASELQMLKMQLHPHFLFNTLHGIATLIDNDQHKAKAMVVALSGLLRTALEHSNSDLIPLQEEMKFIEEYLDLEKMRFGSRLKVEVSIEPDTREILVPQMILQPLAENAIRHGIASSREGGWLAITSHRINGALELCIRNSAGRQRSRGTGVGLRNTEARLKHLYSGDATFSFNLSSDQTATATLVLPALGSHRPLDIDPGMPDSCDSLGIDHARADR